MSFRLSPTVAALALVALGSTPQLASAQVAVPAVETRAAVHHDVSPPLRELAVVEAATPRPEKPWLPVPRRYGPPRVDPVLQSAAGAKVGTVPGLSFAGVGQGDYGYQVQAAPPDTIGAAGATQYVQWVNLSFAVFDKATGALLLGPVAGNTLWAGFGGGCQNDNDGDPIVAYDKQAQRWVMSQFSLSAVPFLQCVAVSTTSDATGTWNRYAFSYNDFPDYPKLGVWSDAYYVSFNMFNAAGTAFLGAKACAWDRAKMLAGAAATQQCFQLSSTFGGLLPADRDGATPPPAGAPNPFVALGRSNTTLDTWKFHADFTTPANATFTGPVAVTVPSYSEACGGGTCIPQSGGGKLDSLADRLMHRLAYRNFGDHESLVVNHSVTAGSSVGVRWYELRDVGTTPTLFQSGTFAPDSSYRWMGSIAMDKLGNMALGYSVSSASMKPAIRYTGRLVGDAAGTMQSENSLKEGAGAQGAGLTRWGDYTAMTIDPVDDCTFFYTNEYLKTNGTFNWSTWIGSFSFPSCSGQTQSDFSLAANPATLTIPRIGKGSSTISTAVVSGTPGTIDLSVSGVPSGATATLSPVSVPAGSSSTLSVKTGIAKPGSYTLTVTGVAGGVTHTVPVTLTITTRR